MHQSSLELMSGFVRARLGPDGGKVLDVGALNINGCYRGLFSEAWEYTGLDIQAGPNVDLVPSAPYAWYELEDSTFDAVISGQCLEHVEKDAALVKEMARVLKPGGWCCLIAPSAGFAHGNETMPDLRRYTAESLAGLATGAGLVVVESYILPRGPWNDAVVVARKVHRGGLVGGDEIPVVLKDTGYMMPKKLIKPTDK